VIVPVGIAQVVGSAVVTVGVAGPAGAPLIVAVVAERYILLHSSQSRYMFLALHQ
jgi:hypothetical protein